MKVAIVGLGPHGKRIAQAVQEAGFALASVVDANSEALGTFEHETEVLRCASADALYDELIPDIVCIATNGPSHAEIALEAMNRGVRRVLVEKPMACSVGECDRMMEVASLRGARLSVDQSRRWDPTYRWLREQIRSRRWGRPRAVWIQRPGVGLGCLATHSFDLVHFLFDQTTLSVTAWVDPPIGRNPRGVQFVDPGGLVVMQLGDGLRAVVAQIEDGSGPMSLELDFTGARIRIDEKSGEWEILERDQSIRPGPGLPPAFSVVALPLELAATPNMPEMLRGVLRELASDAPMDCDASHGRSAIEILIAAYLSHQRGHVPVPLPLASGDRNVSLPIT